MPPVQRLLRGIRRSPAGARPVPAAAERDNPIERLELLSGNDDAIAAFLDELDVRSPRERELMTELARTTPLARPDRFAADHRRAVAAIESLRRHGFHGFRPPRSLGPSRFLVRFGVELVARYIVVSYVKSAATSMRNLYWFREIEAENDSADVALLRAARIDAQALVEITRSRELGVPTFVIGGLLLPLAVTTYRATAGVATDRWLGALLIGLAGVLFGVILSWIVLRGTAMASHRIRISTRGPLQAVWASVGQCGGPPQDQSRTFAIVAIVLTFVAWIVLPTLVLLSVLN